MFLKIGVFLGITGCGKKKRNVRFLVWFAGVAVCGCLLVVSFSLLVVYNLFLVLCSRLWSFASVFWWFVVLCGGLWLLPVLVTTIIVNQTLWIPVKENYLLSEMKEKQKIQSQVKPISWISSKLLLLKKPINLGNGGDGDDT